MSTNLNVSSIKGCWYKFSARIRDYLDVVDSYYRRPDSDDPNNDHHLHHNHADQQSCDRALGAKGDNLGGATSSYGARSGRSSRSHSASGGIIGIGCNPSKSSSRHHQHHQGCTEQASKHLQRQHQHHQTTRNLPPGYSKRKTSLGQVYFVDQNGHKYWLSSTWEIRQTPSGKTYYVNHIKKTTQFTDPRLVAYKDELMSLLRHAQGTCPTSNDTTRNNSNSNTINSSQRTANLNFSRQAAKNSSNKPGNVSDQPPSSNALQNSGYTLANNAQISSSSSAAAPPVRNCQTCSHNNASTTTNNGDSRQRSSTLTLKYTDSSYSAKLRHQIRSIHNSGNGTLRSQTSNSSQNKTNDAPSKHGSHQHHNNNQYRMNLLSSSHHNLSTTTQHSNTLTGPPPAWFRPSSIVGLKRQSQQESACGSIGGGNNTNSATTTMTTNAANVAGGGIDVTSPTSQEQTAMSGSRNIKLNGSVIFPFSANTTQNSTALSPNNTINTTINTNNSYSSALTAEYEAEYISLEQRQQPYQVKSKRGLYDKISILRQELLKQQVITHPCRIDINRKRIFEESFRVVSQMQPRDLKKRLLVKFRGEEGLDYGGVAREWFYLLSSEILNPNHGLFQYTSDDIYNLQINPDSGIVYREHLSYLNFCGRIIGMAVFHGHFIEGHFTLPFYKMLLGKPINLGDIENVDPELHRSLCWILENDITNVIDTTFLVQHNALGQLQEHELKENGRNTVVTEANKQEYVSLYINYRCRRGIESQMEALQRGFYELIQPSLLDNFEERELELLIGGLSKINVEDWRLHTKLKNCNVETPLVRWFWDIVKFYGEDRRARLLQFVTGSPRVPIQGFKALQGVNSELRLFTIHLIRNACTDNLPKSHTCFNRIDLPPYETYEKLRDKLTQAIEETMGFAMQ